MEGITGNPQPKSPQTSKISRHDSCLPRHPDWGDKGLEEQLIHLYWRAACTRTVLNNHALPVPGPVGSDDHLQLPGIFDDLFGQFRGGDGGIFWLLLLAGKTVVVVGAQDPPSLQEGKVQRWVE